MTVTLVLQHHVPAAALRGARRWLYAGDDPAYELEGLERVPTADATMAAARELREPYLEAIGTLSRLNASMEWWASHLAAKQPYPSLFARLCGLAAARELAREDGTLVVCSTPAQLEELKLALTDAVSAGTTLGGVRRRLPADALRLMWPALRGMGNRAPDAMRSALSSADPRARFALERTPGHRRQTLRALGARPIADFAGEDTVLLVTWLDERCFGPDGAYSDPHLGPLGPMLAERGMRVARLLKPLLHAPFADCAGAMLASGESALFADLYLSEADWRSCERRVRAWRPAIPADITVGTVPFARLAAEYVAEHRRAQVDALSHEALVHRLASAGVRPAFIIFPWEGHAWEQVLTGTVKRLVPETTVVGYDNLNFTGLALSLYPAPEEVGIRPLPDRVVTNGRAFADALRASAFPSERVRVGCALRHSRLAGAGPVPGVVAGAGGRGDARGSDGFVLAACSIDAGQSIELLRKAASAFGRELVARLHPASDATAIRAALPGEIRYADEPLSELLLGARLMLYTYSVVPYEALAAGVPPVFVRSESLLDLDQLERTPDVRWVARTTEELQAVASEIASLPDREAWQRRALEVVGAALGPVGPECVEQFVT